MREKLKETFALPHQWREINDGDECCNIDQNLKQGVDYDGSLIDGCWICSICNKVWAGNGKHESEDKYLRHRLETPTEFGMAFMSACDDIIKEGKNLRLNVVLGRMAFKDLDGTKKLLGIG